MSRLYGNIGVNLRRNTSLKPFYFKALSKPLKITTFSMKISYINCLKTYLPIKNDTQAPEAAENTTAKTPIRKP